MTHPWLALFRALLNVNFGISALRAQLRKREKRWEPFLIGASILAGAGVMVWLVATLAAAFVEAGLQFGQPEIALTVAHFVAAVVVLVFGLAYVMGAFYFSNDMGFLPAWPLSARHILSAKFATILVNEYLTTVALLGPVYVMYALRVPVGPLYVPAAIVVFLLTPIIPLAVAALLVLALMRVASISRRRDFFTMLGGLLLMVGALVLQYYLQQFGPQLSSEQDAFELIFGQAHGLSRLAASGYPPSYWSMLALAEAGNLSGLAGLLGLVAGALVAVGVLLFAGDRIFLKAAQSTGVARSRRRVGARSWEGASPIRSVARAERKLFLRNPMYVMNGFAGFAIVPVMLLLPQFMNEQAVSWLLRTGLSDPKVGVVALWAWFAAGTGMSLIPSTAFSREGQKLWILKSLPISGRECFLGKLLGAQSMTLAGALPGAAVLVYVLHLDLAHAAAGILLGVAASVLVAMIGLAIDASRPWLTWTDPTRAIKSNINGPICGVITLALIAVPVWAGLSLIRRGVEPVTVMTLFGALFLVAPFALWRWLAPRLDAVFQRMGD